MEFDRKLSIKERIIKRRKQKRRRFFVKMSLLMVSILILVDFVNSSVYQDLRKVFSYKDSVPSNTQIENTIEEIPSDIPDSLGQVSSIYFGDMTVSGDDVFPENENYIDDYIEEDIDNLVSQDSLDYENLKNELEEYVSRFTGQYGIYFVDLVSGYEFGINDTDEYTAASTIKVPLNYYIFKMIEAGEVDPEDTIAYKEDDFEGGTGILQSKKLKGKSFTIRYLLKVSIIYSDNIATNMLLRHFGRKNFKNYLRMLGGTVVDDNKNVSCPKDMAIYLKNIYEFCNENKELGKELKYNLCNTIHNDRLPRLLPKDVKVAHKIGDQIQAVHDVGIIYADNPYILAVMSKGVISDEEARSVIAQVSKKVYDFMNGK
ncbi:serine hydrolase [Acetivibrio clariflavus]|uniref:Beta-lactamase class A n=1 Tax=Acetivibrio clariflavus (strain DSM 19732 / NBRC 101661 / EBR45) TaxID=720554 RepID=G8LU97_ACECE|nr:serine hydrolase [Acetivibrio clariflavus]AEV69529.1 beta-lactamase class A [Acetivibrio clariflavus DSM 19732]